MYMTRNRSEVVDEHTSSSRNSGPSGMLQDRRRVLKTIAGGSTVGLAGCLGGLTGGGSKDNSDSGDLADSLVVQMSGGHYLDSYKKKVFSKFTDEYGVDVKFNLVSDQFDGYSKIKTGQSDADLTIASASTLYMGSKENVWLPLETSELENYNKLLDVFKNPIYDPGEKIHALPTVYGTVGMAYNKKELGKQDSWKACWDTAHKGRVTMEGFGFVRVFTTALQLGMDPNDIKVNGSYNKGIKKVWDSVRKQKPLVTKYWTSGDEHVRLYTQKQALIGEAWGGRIYGAVQDGYDFLDYVVPKEGAYGWSDNWVIVDGVSDKKKKTALTFMNFLSQDDVILPLCEMLGYPPATGATSKAVKNLYDYDPSGGKRLTFLDPAYKDKHNDKWSQTWETIQSG